MNLHFPLAYYLCAPYYRRLVEEIGLSGCERVLDFGSGSGAVSRHIAQRLADGGGRLTLVDVSREAMEFARQRLGHLPHLEFMTGDLLMLDLGEHTFDVAVAHFVIHDVDPASRQNVVSALASKLKTGGRLVIREPADLRMHRKSHDAGKHGLTAEEIDGLVKAAGLEQVERRLFRLPLVGLVHHGVYMNTAFDA